MAMIALAYRNIPEPFVRFPTLDVKQWNAAGGDLITSITLKELNAQTAEQFRFCAEKSGDGWKLVHGEHVKR